MALLEIIVEVDDGTIAIWTARGESVEEMAEHVLDDSAPAGKLTLIAANWMKAR